MIEKPDENYTFYFDTQTPTVCATYNLPFLQNVPIKPIKPIKNTNIIQKVLHHVMNLAAEEAE